MTILPTLFDLYTRNDKSHGLLILRNFSKVTNKSLLKKYPEFEWKEAMGMRDIISHQYFDLNSDIVFQVCKEEIPVLKRLIKKMLKELTS
jgi:uncharacterized protein with HEPN domain